MRTLLSTGLVSLVLLAAACTASPELESRASGETNPTYGVQNFALSAQYPPATWTPSPNFKAATRKPPQVTTVIIHTTQGTYQSAIDWFLTPSAQVSAHYVVSKKGAITQMVQEEDIAWHVGSENSYTIGIEHEGMVDDPTWATEAMLDASAKLTCHLLQKWQLPADRAHVKGHVELPNQTHTDPGKYWPWDTYMAKVATCMPGGVTPTCADCDDNNACTHDTCPAGSCVHTPREGACEDGSPCSVGDTCSAGKCMPGPNKGCQDVAGSSDAGDGSAETDAKSAAGDAVSDAAGVTTDVAPSDVGVAAPSTGTSGGCTAGTRADVWGFCALMLGAGVWIRRRRA